MTSVDSDNILNYSPGKMRWRPDLYEIQVLKLHILWSTAMYPSSVEWEWRGELNWRFGLQIEIAVVGSWINALTEEDWVSMFLRRAPGARVSALLGFGHELEGVKVTRRSSDEFKFSGPCCIVFHWRFTTWPLLRIWVIGLSWKIKSYGLFELRFGSLPSSLPLRVWDSTWGCVQVDANMAGTSGCAGAPMRRTSPVVRSKTVAFAQCDSPIPCRSLQPQYPPGQHQSTLHVGPRLRAEGLMVPSASDAATLCRQVAALQIDVEALVDGEQRLQCINHQLRERYYGLLSIRDPSTSSKIQVRVMT